MTVRAKVAGLFGVGEKNVYPFKNKIFINIGDGDHELTFTDLDELSILLQSKKINIEVEETRMGSSWTGPYGGGVEIVVYDSPIDLEDNYE